MVKEEIFVQLESRTYSHKKNKAEREGRGKGHSEGTSEQRLEWKAWILGKCNHKMKLGVYGSWRNDLGES